MAQAMASPLRSVKRSVWYALGVSVLIFAGTFAFVLVRIIDSPAASKSRVVWTALLTIPSAILTGVVVGLILSYVQGELTDYISKRAVEASADLQFNLVIQTAPSLAGFNLRRRNLTGMHFPGRDFTDATLGDAILDGVMLDRCKFDNADLTRASLKGASLRDCVFGGSDLTSAKLLGADLAGSTFVDVKWDETTEWPSGFTPPPQPAPHV